MFYGVLTAFLSGWTGWFLLDKSSAALGAILPAAQESLVANFQIAFDMLKSGYVSAAYAFLWYQHFIVLSLLVGLLLSMIGHQILVAFRRRRFWSQHLPVRPDRKPDTS